MICFVIFMSVSGAPIPEWTKGPMSCGLAEVSAARDWQAKICKYEMNDDIKKVQYPSKFTCPDYFIVKSVEHVD